MITVVATFVLHPEINIVWEEVWPQTYAAWSRQPGLRGAHLLRDVTRPARYVLYSEWEGREHANAFMRSSGMLWFLRGMNLCVEHPTFLYLDGGSEAVPVR
jgi:heme-degrading monooxygenase HmoA